MNLLSVLSNSQLLLQVQNYNAGCLTATFSSQHSLEKRGSPRSGGQFIAESVDSEKDGVNRGVSTHIKAGDTQVGVSDLKQCDKGSYSYC